MILGAFPKTTGLDVGLKLDRAIPVLNHWRWSVLQTQLMYGSWNDLGKCECTFDNIAGMDQDQGRYGMCYDRPGVPDARNTQHTVIKAKKGASHPCSIHTEALLVRTLKLIETCKEQQERPHGQPERPHGQPERPHGQPERPHGQPECPHGQPERPHGQPERPHGQQEDKLVRSLTSQHQVWATLEGVVEVINYVHKCLVDHQNLYTEDLPDPPMRGQTRSLSARPHLKVHRSESCSNPETDKERVQVPVPAAHLFPPTQPKPIRIEKSDPPPLVPQIAQCLTTELPDVNGKAIAEPDSRSEIKESETTCKDMEHKSVSKARNAERTGVELNARSSNVKILDHPHTMRVLILKQKPPSAKQEEKSKGKKAKKQKKLPSTSLAWILPRMEPKLKEKRNKTVVIKKIFIATGVAKHTKLVCMITTRNERQAHIESKLPPYDQL